MELSVKEYGKKILSLLGYGSAIAATTFVVGVYQPQIHNDYLRTAVGDSVVKVMVSERGGGSGFAVRAASGKEYFATNKHVCEGALDKGWVKIKSDSGLSAWKRIVYIDNKHDICLVEGDRRFSPLKLGDKPSRGEYHYIVGHPGLRPLTVSQGEFVGMETIELLDNVKTREQCQGKVVELNPFEAVMFGSDFACIRAYVSYQSSAVAYGGNSGSPVVNKYGNVIGILYAGPRDQEHVSYIVPINELRRVLSKF
jgi:S1-C subfamily serine protease